MLGLHAYKLTALLQPPTPSSNPCTPALDGPICPPTPRNRSFTVAAHSAEDKVLGLATFLTVNYNLGGTRFISRVLDSSGQLVRPVIVRDGEHALKLAGAALAGNAYFVRTAVSQPLPCIRFHWVSRPAEQAAPTLSPAGWQRAGWRTQDCQPCAGMVSCGAASKKHVKHLASLLDPLAAASPPCCAPCPCSFSVCPAGHLPANHCAAVDRQPG